MKEKIKTFFNRYKIIIFSAILLIFFTVNLLSAIFGNDTSATTKSLVLTVISGWLSCIATLAVGIMAYLQSKKYKEESDQYEKRLEDRAWCQEHYREIIDYRDQIVKRCEDFLAFSPIDIIDKMLIEKMRNGYSFASLYSSAKLGVMRSNIALSLTMASYYFEGADELLNAFRLFKNNMNDTLDQLENHGLNKDNQKYITDLQKSYLSVSQAFKVYLSYIDLTVSAQGAINNRTAFEKVLHDKAITQDAWVKTILEKDGNNSND